MCYLPILGTRLQCPLTLLNIRINHCHEKSSSFKYNFVLMTLAGLILAHSAAAQTPAASQIPPPAVPPKTLNVGEWNIHAEYQEQVGTVYKFRGNPAEILSAKMLVRA